MVREQASEKRDRSRRLEVGLTLVNVAVNAWLFALAGTTTLHQLLIPVARVFNWTPYSDAAELMVAVVIAPSVLPIGWLGALGLLGGASPVVCWGLLLANGLIWALLVSFLYRLALVGDLRQARDRTFGRTKRRYRPAAEKPNTLE